MIRSKGTSCLLLPDSKMLKICKTINNRKYYEKYDDGDDDDDDGGISENSILIGSPKNIVHTLAIVHCNNNVDDYNVSNNNEKETIDTDLVEKNNNNDSNGGDGSGNIDKDNNKNIDENDGNNAVSQKTNNTDESTIIDDALCSLVEVTNKNSSINEKYKEEKNVEEEDVYVTRENLLEKEEEMIGNYVHMGFKSKYDTETGKKENGIFVDNNINDDSDNIEEDQQYISMNVGKLYKLLKYNNSSDFEDYLDEPNNIPLLMKPYRGSYNNNYYNNGGSGGGGKMKSKNMYSFNKSLNKKIKEFGCDVPSTKHSRSILKMKNNNSTFKSYLLESTETNSSSATTTITAGYDSPRKQSTFKSYIDSPNSTYSTPSNQSWYNGKREVSEIVKEHRRSKLLKSENSNNYADYVDVNDIIVDGNNSIIVKQKKSDENKQQRAADKEEVEEEDDEEEKQRQPPIGALNACLKKMEYVKKRKQEENLKFEEKRRQAIENNYDKCCVDTLCKLNELSRKIDYVVRRIEFQNKKLNVIYSYVERQNEIYYRNKVVLQQFEETGGEKDNIVDTQTVTNHSYSEIMKKVSIYDRMKKCFSCL